MPAATIRRHVGSSVWDSYLKFTIERNPFDRAVSRYWYSTRGLEPRPSLTEYLLTLSPAQLQNWPVYTINDQVAVDWVMRYEDLDEEVVKLGDRLLIDLRLPEKRAKGQSREDHRPHSEVIEPAARAWIEEVCGRKLQEFGYCW